MRNAALLPLVLICTVLVAGCGSEPTSPAPAPAFDSGAIYLGSGARADSGSDESAAAAQDSVPGDPPR